MTKRPQYPRSISKEITRLQIDEADWFSFGELYSVLVAFADKPENVISRIGRGRISIPEDQANHLYHFRRYILQKYPAAAELSLMEVVERIDVILSNKSAGGDLFDPTFWTNNGFMRHPDWADIREIAQAFLLH